MKGAVVTREETKQNGSSLATSKDVPFYSLQREMNKLFEDFRHGFGFFPHTPFEPITEFHAKVEVKENEKEILVTAEVPGVDMKDIDISLRPDAIAIQGEKHQEKEEKEKGYYRMERSYGSFYRLIPLPCGVDRDNVKATLKDGVLKISLPKTKEALQTEKKIPVSQV
jgi:HSP20 family protein